MGEGKGEGDSFDLSSTYVRATGAGRPRRYGNKCGTIFEKHDPLKTDSHAACKGEILTIFLLIVLAASHKSTAR